MKKWWIVLVAAAVACVGIGFVLRRPEETVTVRTTRLQPQTVEQTVSCAGIVEAANGTGVFAPTVCILKEVTAQEGKPVKAGDVLAVVDKETTRLAGLADSKAAALALAAMPDKLTAPEDGILVAVNGHTGQTLEEGTPCVVIAPRSSVQVRIAIREKDLRKLKEGMPVRVTGDGFSKKSYTGTLTEISSTAHTKGGETVVEGVVSLQSGQVDDSMRLGLTAKAAVITSSKEDGVVVPYEAVREDDNAKEYVYVLQDGVAVRRELKVAAELMDGLLLEDTSLAGATLITQPDLVPEEGAAVAVEGNV